MTDPIADLLTRIRNAGMAQHAQTRVPFSRIKQHIVEILEREGFISGFEIVQGESGRKEIVVGMRYVNENKVAFHEMKRVSRPGRRVYFSASDIPQVKSGLGISVVSTSKGVVCDREARKMNVGGEVLCTVW
jgi:small subunit ribosomal protein S8